MRGTTWGGGGAYRKRGGGPGLGSASMSRARIGARLEDIADFGDTCHWCDKTALRREIKPGHGPRVYIGACRTHVDNLRDITMARVMPFAGRSQRFMEKCDRLNAKSDFKHDGKRRFK